MRRTKANNMEKKYTSNPREKERREKEGKHVHVYFGQFCNLSSDPGLSPPDIVANFTCLVVTPSFDSLALCIFEYLGVEEHAMVGTL